MTQERPTATNPTSRDAVGADATQLFVVQVQLSETCDSTTVKLDGRGDHSPQAHRMGTAALDVGAEHVSTVWKSEPGLPARKRRKPESASWARVPGALEKPLGQRSRRTARAWHMRILPDVLDRLREHPNFALHEELEGVTAQNALPLHAVEEADREPTYRMELLRMFRERMSLLAVLGAVLLPIFSLFYAYLQPGTADNVYTGPVLLTHGLMMVTCLLLRLAAPRLRTLGAARVLSVVGYAAFCMGSAVVGTILSQNQFGDDAVAIRAIQFTVLASHSQIMLSILLMPFTVWESVVVAIIVTCTLAWSLWLPSPPDFQPIYISQMFMLVTTAFFVLCIAHFQNVLRRHAFDAAFDLAHSVAQLQTLSTQDPVTGGFNRRYLEKMLAIEIARASRFSRPLSVLMFDLDNFKQVNDTHGHATGDDVLRYVWEAAQSTVREIDTVARYGGDEFVAVLPEADSEAARVIAERLQASAHYKLQEAYGSKSIEGQVTLSIGITTAHPTEPVPVESIIALADERLYDAKRSGKNRISL